MPGYRQTHTNTHTSVCKYLSMLTHTHKTVICSSSPQYIRHCNRPRDIRSNECIHQRVQCDGTCVFLSPGPQQPRKPHVHLCGFKHPPEPHRKHPALQQKGKTFSLSLTLPFLASIVCGLWANNHTHSLKHLVADILHVNESCFLFIRPTAELLFLCSVDCGWWYKYDFLKLEIRAFWWGQSWHGHPSTCRHFVWNWVYTIIRYVWNMCYVAVK